MAPLYQSIAINSNSDEASKLVVRDTIANENDVENGYFDNAGLASTSCGESIGSQLKKRPLLIFSTMLLLACTVGHTLTVIYYWDNIKSNSSSSNNISSTWIDETSSQDREMKEKSKKHKAQKFADEQRKHELDNPSLKSELFHNKTLSLLLSSQREDVVDDDDEHYPILGKSKKSNDSNPVPLPPPNDCQATIMIIRHCEKGDVREHCNLLGFERSKYIATLFGDNDERWPSPARIYALAPGDRSNDLVKNFREVETVTPLSQKLNVPIDASYGLNDKNDFADHLFGRLRSGEACGKIALISWKHTDIPSLAHRLGCGPKQGCPTDFDDMDFDSAWEIRYMYKKEQYAPYPIAEEGKKKHKLWGLHPEWWVFGKVEKENFDPLAYSKEIGTYNSR